MTPYDLFMMGCAAMMLAGVFSLVGMLVYGVCYVIYNRKDIF